MLEIDQQKGHIVTYDNNATSKGERKLRVKAIAAMDSIDQVQGQVVQRQAEAGYSAPLEWNVAMEVADQERDIYKLVERCCKSNPINPTV